MAAASSLISQTLPLPPSCIAFCPTQPDIFVVGTYFLHKDESVVVNGKIMPWQKRSGSLILYRIEQVAGEGKFGVSIHELCTLPTDSAVLDVQWSPHRRRGREAFAVATSVAMLECYEIELSEDHTRAKIVSSTWVGSFEDLDDPEPRDLLALSLAWHPTESQLLAVPLSNGEVQFCESHDDFMVMGDGYSSGALSDLQHELEAWTAAFSPSSTSLFSGGDDCALRYMQLRRDSDENMTVEASWQDKKLHNAGVTAILPLNDHYVVTGSYDDHVRLIYAPPVGRRKVLAERNLEGGVWRLKMIESSEVPDLAAGAGSSTFSCTILASCMHAGARVLRLRKGADGQCRFEVITEFTDHKSMNYGSDVQPLESVSPESEDEAVKRRTVVSTSFYDKLLCVWQFDMDAEEHG